MQQLKQSAQDTGFAFPPQLFDLQDRKQDRRPKQHKRANCSGSRSTGRVDEVSRPRERGSASRAESPLVFGQVRDLMDQSATVTGFEVAQVFLTDNDP